MNEWGNGWMDGWMDGDMKGCVFAALSVHFGGKFISGLQTPKLNFESKGRAPEKHLI